MKTWVLLSSAIVFLALMLIAATWLWGRSLPATRVGVGERDIAAPIDQIQQVIADVQRQPDWRRAVKAVEIGTDGGWTEVRSDGDRIRMSWIDQSGHTLRLRFASERGYEGVWEGRFAPLPTPGGTRVSVREESTISNPLL
jgi:hypothetical protein